ncbi:hypothetical protein E2C01_060436 [Portunus trituberculatus]|uniref:Uncharacterized protein n=1 Tax=Portunus trituberculatus TaxID=210409 RepID=A0A5B7H915_PORTR|nr:hypothetical protein [Portunus trituberculatus]
MVLWQKSPHLVTLYSPRLALYLPSLSNSILPQTPSLFPQCTPTDALPSPSVAGNVPLTVTFTSLVQKMLRSVRSSTELWFE